MRQDVYIRDLQEHTPYQQIKVLNKILYRINNKTIDEQRKFYGRFKDRLNKELNTNIRARSHNKSSNIIDLLREDEYGRAIIAASKAAASMDVFVKDILEAGSLKRL